ncbi:hypothetical protein ACFYO6_14880 [Streptomyces anthocyanicus]|uniref:hypothetical protein n=1 Tax=Streptomyces anthocyanicus TaxID=68174 RepID=UPI0036AA22C3
MFTSLLPGFRHFRTPFTVGAIVAFEWWAILGERIPKPGQAHGFLQRVYSLAEFAGRPVVAAAIAFTLYLVGNVLTLKSWQAMRLVHTLSRVLPAPIFSSESIAQLHQLIRKAFDRRGMTDVAELRRVVREMQAELISIRMHLTANHVDVYLEHDRLDSEAEFRFNVAVHLVTVWCVLSVLWSPWFFIGFALTAILYHDGLISLRDANAILVQSVVSGLVTSQVYEREIQRDREHDASAGVA